MTGNTGSDSREFVALYDQAILHPMTRAQYGGSGYYNVGYWGDAPKDIEAACAALVERHILAAALDRPGLSIMDVGCGLGASTAQIKRAATADAAVAGINISEAQLADARQRHAGIEFIAMDAANLELPAECCDRMIAVEAVFHFNSRAGFLDGALRVLKPGGLLVFTDVLFTEESDPWDWWVPAVNRKLSIAAYAATCAAHGFEVKQLDDITAQSWTPFCAGLRATGRQAAADRIESWVANYLFVVLRKPAA